MSLAYQRAPPRVRRFAIGLPADRGSGHGVRCHHEDTDWAPDPALRQAGERGCAAGVRLGGKVVPEPGGALLIALGGLLITARRT